MYVKGNAVLSKMFAHQGGLVLNEKGLFYHLKEDTTFEFLITNDPKKILDILEFNHEEFEAAKGYHEFFELLKTNKYFRPSRFVVDSTDGHNKMLKELAEYLNANPYHKGYTTRQVEDMFEPLKEYDFEKRYKRLLELKANEAKIKNRINGGLVLKLRPGFNPRDLQPKFEAFSSKFKSVVDKYEFLYASTDEEIVTEFLK